MKHIKKNKKGFSLMELLVVIAIIGILAGVVLVSMASYARRGRASRVLAQASSVLPSMVSCAGNGGTPLLSGSGNICSGITGAANYGSWPTWPNNYNVVSPNNWNSSSDWVFAVSGESQIICCNSKMNGCGMPATCSATATW